MADAATSPSGSVTADPAELAPPLTAATRLRLRELRIVPEGDDFLVGDPARGEFVAVPEVAVTVISLLRDGYTLGETAARVQEQTGEQVDVADFAATLVELGFVAATDGVPVDATGPELADGGRLGAAAARVARPLYSAPAFAVYGLLFAGCVLALTAVPALRPRVTQLFFLPNPVLSVALLTAVGMPLAMTHELAHWLGARVNGAGARITVSRRYYMMVLQTDLSALWGVPRRQRFGPLLAGIAWDTVRLAALIALRAAALARWWNPGALGGRLIAALIVTHVLAISWQFFVFLRTDVYAVLAVGLGCLNLTRISRLADGAQVPRADPGGIGRAGRRGTARPGRGPVVRLGPGRGPGPGGVLLRPVLRAAGRVDRPVGRHRPATELAGSVRLLGSAGVRLRRARPRRHGGPHLRPRSPRPPASSRKGGHPMKKIKVKKVEKILATATAIEY